MAQPLPPSLAALLAPPPPPLALWWSCHTVSVWRGSWCWDSHPAEGRKGGGHQPETGDARPGYHQGQGCQSTGPLRGVGGPSCGPYQPASRDTHAVKPGGGLTPSSPAQGPPPPPPREGWGLPSGSLLEKPLAAPAQALGPTRQHRGSRGGPGPGGSLVSGLGVTVAILHLSACILTCRLGAGTHTTQACWASQLCTFGSPRASPAWVSSGCLGPDPGKAGQGATCLGASQPAPMARLLPKATGTGRSPGPAQVESQVSAGRQASPWGRWAGRRIGVSG